MINKEWQQVAKLIFKKDDIFNVTQIQDKLKGKPTKETFYKNEIALPAEKKNYGTFFCPNPLKSNQRKASNVSLINCVYIDLDDQRLPEKFHVNLAD